MSGEANPRQRIRTCTWVYAGLMLLTVLTWGVGRSGLSGLGLALFVLFLALLKGHLVGDWFMGLRGVRGIWRWAVVVWLLLPGSLITVAFVLSYRG